MGTPIFAAGNGMIEKAGLEGGYGKYIRIRHANGYETAYGHMSAFARGMEPGKRVRQGQVIGYVGSTGLSTGAHLHYEILINGRFVDPMKIKLPRGRVLEGPVLAGFDQERDAARQHDERRDAVAVYASGVAPGRCKRKTRTLEADHGRRLQRPSSVFVCSLICRVGGALPLPASWRRGERRSATPPRRACR